MSRAGDREKAVRVMLLLFALAAADASAQFETGPDSLYDIRDSVLIAARDGYSISATVVTRKGAQGRLPAILFFTTYDQGRSDYMFGKISADRDYAGIVAYSRGIRTDLDEYVPYEHDGDDVYDVIEWISAQPWCDGRVAMFGGSYTGFVQWSALRKPHPALKTVVPQVAVLPGFDTPMENNIPQGFTLSWPNSLLYADPLPPDLNRVWYEKGTSYRTLDSLAGRPNRFFRKWLEHPDYDAYWSSMTPSPEEYAAIDIPILCTTGYYDGAQLGTLEYVKRYFRHHRNPDLYLVIGPYDHWGGQRAKPADTLMSYPIDSVAKQSMRGLAFEWFDHILKGKPKPALLRDRINVQVMGANLWRHAPSLQALSNDTLTFHLSTERSGANYALTNRPPAGPSFLGQTVDFKDRTTQNNYFTPVIMLDSLDISNGLAFESEPLPSMTINGLFFGTIGASINKMDMDVSIAFYEHMPDGKYFFLTRYLGRASYAHDNRTRRLLTPGAKESIPIAETRMACRQISEGSRLVVILNVNKHPWEEINYGSGKDVHDETMADAAEPLRVKWHTDTVLKIPVLR